jgi:hypothetical protein
MMKKLLVSLLAIVLVTGVSLPTASAAWGGWHGREGWGERHDSHRGGGCVGCAILGGLVLGGILGGALAAPYYSAPPPVYAPPPPTCYTQPGHWEQVPAYTAPNGYTTYQNVWVPAQTVCQ